LEEEERKKTGKILVPAFGHLPNSAETTPRGTS
jgi:hypothetical protein